VKESKRWRRIRRTPCELEVESGRMIEAIPMSVGHKLDIVLSLRDRDVENVN
jgi:hypothetical protein